MYNKLLLNKESRALDAVTAYTQAWVDRQAGRRDRREIPHAGGVPVTILCFGLKKRALSGASVGT